MWRCVRSGSPDLDTSIYYSTPTGFFVFWHSSLHFEPNFFFDLFCMPSIEINKVLLIDSLWTMGPLGGTTYMRKDTSYCQRLWPLRRWELAKICCGPFLGLWTLRRMRLVGFGSMEQDFWHTAWLRTKSRCHFLGFGTQERIWTPIHPYGENRCNGTYAEMKPAASDLRT